MSNLPSSSPPCPSGGHFYACTRFVGCCTIETCNGGDGLESCPLGDLTPGHLLFDLDAPADFLSAAAPSISLTTLYLASPTSTDTAVPPGGAVPETFTAQGSAISASVPDSVPAATTLGQSSLQAAKPVPRSNTAAIAGGVVGGIVGLAFLLAFLAICCRRRTTRPLQDIDDARSPALGTGNIRALQPDDAELEEMKQGPPPISSPLPPPSPSTSPLLPPPAYTPYRPHGNELNRSPDLSQPSASSPYLPHDLTSPESPPSPPPLQSRLSQHSVDRYSEEQSVSPISSHYQHQPFGDNGDPELGMYSEVLPSELLHTHGMRS